MTAKKNVLEFELTAIDEIPLGRTKSRHRKKKIDVEETEYLYKIGRKPLPPKQTKMTADYIQEIYNRDKKEKKKDE